MCSKSNFSNEFLFVKVIDRMTSADIGLGWTLLANSKSSLQHSNSQFPLEHRTVENLLDDILHRYFKYCDHYQVTPNPECCLLFRFQIPRFEPSRINK